MIKFCRNCGKQLAGSTDRNCQSCGSNAVKAHAFCRFCGNATNPGDAVCSNCGLAVRPISHNERVWIDAHSRLAKIGKTVNITLVILLVAAYVIFSLPKAITKPIKATASNIVQEQTGYTALPLAYLSATPAFIPSLGNVGEVTMPSSFDINATRQVTICAIYKNTGSSNETKATRLEYVTDNCTFKSSDTSVVQVSEDGVIRAVGYGKAVVTAYYTAAPGTSNRTAASSGKIPVTFSVTVEVTVGHRGEELFNATYT